ncbi:GH36 C-terminal domain-containing protein [Streptomyces sp. MMS24-I29]|uniref:GH36 C-terminal domain-containing protein n=1 Tax=Streptomyces sp. MMS24-I29 TaxID=3351480 RepID=UPI003C7997A0
MSRAGADRISSPDPAGPGRLPGALAARAAQSAGNHAPRTRSPSVPRDPHARQPESASLGEEYAVEGGPRFGAPSLTVRFDEVVAFQFQPSAPTPTAARTRLKGLDPDARHRDEATGAVHEGAVLLSHGLPPLPSFDWTSELVHLKRVPR